ncbi:hypothetical protein [Halomonas dongshanensis]|uniref:Uncharacterized protein n=1 Tax=Halomonas dongshanensis TaxID=2890835 RepID=A0ABT2EC35_9GAMM|nr:hypothetical protein [Halomonas dongshanensis]MCS2608212.1 hypothetical protein [Halomonas dongshanensis]
MTSEQRQLRQTLIFLRTSFEAVQHSIAGRLDDPLPCWLDTGMLSMLSRELHRVAAQGRTLFTVPVQQQLYIADQQCDLLLRQCPGVMSSAICHRQLGAILLPLSAAIANIAVPAPKRRWFWQR